MLKKSLLSTLLASSVLLSGIAVANAQTTYTGDVVRGAKVVSELDVTDLSAGRHELYFQGADNGIGSYYQIPLVILKGEEDGPKLMIQSAIHGDELEGIQVIHHLLEDIKAEDIAGTLVVIPGANPSGMRMHSRNFYATNEGGTFENLNRLMPGKEGGRSPGARYAHKIFHGVYEGNADIFLDLHTNRSGGTFPFFIYADERDAEISKYANLAPADQIKDDPGMGGTVETELVNIGVDAMTWELGRAKVYNPEITARAVQGIKNIMIDQGMIEGQIDMMGVETIKGNGMSIIRAEKGGFVENHVALNDKVEKGQLLATQKDAFGNIVREYKSPADGWVLQHSTDPLREPASLLFRILTVKPAS